MALNYTVHKFATPVYGQLPIGALLPVAEGDVLALDTVSFNIVGPCELELLADEKVRIDCQATPGALDPASSPIVLAAGVVRRFSLNAGKWYIRATAFV